MWISPATLNMQKQDSSSYFTLEDPNLRRSGGAYENSTNRLQKKLLSIYDRWAIDMRSQILEAQDASIAPEHFQRIIAGRTKALGDSLVEAESDGISSAMSLAVSASLLASTSVQTALLGLTLASAESIRTSLLDSIQTRLSAKLAKAEKFDRSSLKDIFDSARSSVASSAGFAWSGIFLALAAGGKEQERRSGVAQRVRWVLNDLADHCVASADHFGCPDLKKTYESWSDLPTVPAGSVTCRGNCVIPGQSIQASGLQASMRMPYSGPVLKLVTKKGLELTITPNHPILTSRGWMPANLINEGTYIVSGSFSKTISQPIYNHNYHIPTRIEQVHSTLAVPNTNSRFSSSFVAMPHDFHGDARFMDGDVDIVWADSQLLSKVVNAVLSQHDDKFILSGANLGQRGLPSHSTTVQILDRTFASSNHGMITSNLRSPLLDSHSTPFNRFSLTLSSGLDSVIEQETFNSSSTYSKSFGETVFGLPIDVEFDKVIDIVYDNFTGHVYDLQTFPSFYTVNGIVVHNCRCRLEVEVETKSGDKEWIRGLPDLDLEELGIVL